MNRKTEYEIKRMDRIEEAIKAKSKEEPLSPETPEKIRIGINIPKFTGHKRDCLYNCVNWNKFK